LEVSRRLGHSDYAFTARIYSHLKAEDTTAVAASFDKRAANVKRLALVS
jgi:integrase